MKFQCSRNSESFIDCYVTEKGAILISVQAYEDGGPIYSEVMLSPSEKERLSRYLSGDDDAKEDD